MDANAKRRKTTAKASASDDAGTLANASSGTTGGQGRQPSKAARKLSILELGTLAQEQAVGHKCGADNATSARLQLKRNFDDLARDQRRVYRRTYASGDDLHLDRRRLQAAQQVVPGLGKPGSLGIKPSDTEQCFLKQRRLTEGEPTDAFLTRRATDAPT